MADLTGDSPYEKLVKALHAIHGAISPTTGNMLGASTIDGIGASNPLYAMIMSQAQGDIQPSTFNRQAARLAQLQPAVPLAGGGQPIDDEDRPSPPISGPQNPAFTPSSPAAIQPTQPMPPVQGLDLPNQPVPMPRPRPQMAAPVPMPQPRPQDAPQSPGMSWFQRNAAMMQDPLTGQFIDPTNAAIAKQQADQNGSALIKKMLSYVNNKADNAGNAGNNSDPSTFGG